jgi:hypothetical protein
MVAAGEHSRRAAGSPSAVHGSTSIARSSGLFARAIRATAGHARAGRPFGGLRWTRHDQRAFFAQQERPGDSMFAHQTSGSTSLPIRFHITRESWEWRNAIVDRAYGFAQAEEGKKSLYVWAADQAKPSLKQRVKHGAHMALQRRALFDAFQQFGDAEREACIRLINRFRPHAIVGYTGQLVDIARYARDHAGLLTWKRRRSSTRRKDCSPASATVAGHLVGKGHVVWLA